MCEEYWKGKHSDSDPYSATAVCEELFPIIQARNPLLSIKVGSLRSYLLNTTTPEKESVQKHLKIIIDTIKYIQR